MPWPPFSPPNIGEGVNLQNVNSGVNIDANKNGVPDIDRNFDGYRDLESYTPMNTDKDDDFQRDDPNSYMCDPSGTLLTFGRSMKHFSIPTKMGVFSSGPYFHDHVAWSLRALVDPEAQILSTVYGTPAYQAAGMGDLPETKKLYNEFHDVRGHQAFVPLVSKVQLNLQSTNVQADIEAILAYIESL